MTHLHSIHRLRGIPLPQSSEAELFPCTIQEISRESLSKTVADVNRMQVNQCKENGLRLGVSDERIETQVYRRREYTGSKKVGSSLRKSRITKAFQPIALGRHIVCLRKRCAGDAPAFGLPAESLRPCSRLNASLYGQFKSNK